MDIPLSSDALDLSFHPSPSTNLLAVGLISGKIQLINYDDFVSSPPSTSSASAAPASKKLKFSSPPPSSKLYSKQWVSRPSKKSCRGLSFSPSGSLIYSISKDKSLFSTDTESGKIVQTWSGVHEAAPSRVLPIDELVVTGDDDGVVRLFDPRKEGKEVRRWDHHFDWITDMVYLPDLPVKKEKKGKGEEGRKSKSQLKKERKRARQAAALKGSAEQEEEGSDSDSEEEKFEGRSRLIVTSGDGTLSSIDLLSSGPNSFEQSEDQEDELLSITSIRSSSKLVVGTQLGILSLWAPSRGLLDHVDRVPGHPASVDTLVTLDSETVLTGSSDGLVRVVQILPSKLLGVIASHDGLPVERMARKEGVLGSLGHSNSVKLTDLTPLLEEDDGEGEEEGEALGIVGFGSDDDSEDEDEDEEDEVEGVDGLLSEEGEGEEVDAEEEDDDDEDDDEVEEEEDDSPPPPPVAKKGKNKGSKGNSGGSFFSDM